MYQRFKGFEIKLIKYVSVKKLKFSMIQGALENVLKIVALLTRCLKL